MDSLPEYPFLVPTLYHIVDRHTHKSWCVPVGKRNFHNLMLIVEGEGAAWTNGKETRLSPGMLVYHPTNEEFGYETSRTNYLRCMGGNFVLTAVIPEGSQTRSYDVPKLPFDTYTVPDNFDRFVRLFMDLSLAWGNGIDHRMLACRSHFMKILDELFQVYSLNTESHKYKERIQHVIKYMETHYHQKLTLSALSELAGLTPSYFGQSFRRIMGMTPIEYLNSIRIDEAQFLLEKGCTISEVTAKVGFSDPFYFSRIFKKNKGISPSEYIKRATLF
ncbi:AraC family transcriptional regulator [Paenibacillus sp. 32352]|uniref:AraC family transcriptional regulator n=1 Tax=Paenibacillus sp. 32352 TaxID=1969111 RepID=UPI0009ABD7A9|nr:AraC family transcriptional regulator [Paenibacillus sp. 32352]